MSSSRATFLIADDNPEGRFILAKTLLRKFPQALIQECTDSDVAAGAVTAKVTAALVHRTADASGLEVVRKLRSIDADVPIIMLSGDEKLEGEAMKAGATKFLHYDKWLLVGSLIQGLLLPRTDDHGSSASPLR